MIPLARFPARVPGGVPRRHRGRVQRADAAVAAADGRAQRPARARSATISTTRFCCSCRSGCCSAWSPALATALLARGDRRRTAARAADRHRRRRPSSSVVFELLLPLLIVGRDPERVLECCCRRSRPVARLLRADHATGRPRRSARRAAAAVASRRRDRRRAGEPTKAYLETAEQEGHHRGRGAPAAPEHRRLRRHAGARGHDAAPRHRRHPRRRDDRRPAGAVPRAGVLAVSGLQGQPRQHRRLRVREGSGGARQPRRRRGRSRRCCVRRSSCPRASACRSC